MGNYMSCTLSGIQSSGPKVILPDGGVLRLGPKSATAAELMFDHPGYFLVHSSSMLCSRRLVAVSADEELEFGVVYAMFTMDRIGSVVTSADMGRLLLAAGKEASRSAGVGGSSQVIPEGAFTVSVTEAAPEKRWKLEPLVDGDLMARLRCAKARCWSRKPVLDTIMEEAVC